MSLKEISARQFSQSEDRIQQTESEAVTIETCLIIVKIIIRAFVKWNTIIMHVKNEWL